jgi:predicted CXXCH cytochrome family protein
MKRWLLFVLAVVLAAGGSTVALAGVEGTHHDMGAYLGAASGDACYACHGYKETSAGNANLGVVGSMCYTRCHLGTGGVSGSIPLANSYPEIGSWDNVNNRLDIGTYTGSTLAKYTEGHKMSIAAMPLPDTAAMVQANTTWPYTQGTGLMECTSCHDVHSNANAPFLRAPLSDNTTPANAFCHRCHAAGNTATPARWTDMNALPNGAHPSETLNTIGGWGNAASRTGNNRLGRNITFKDQRTTSGGGPPAALNDNGVFRNWSYSGATLNSSANHYNPGGKLGDFQGSGPVGCYTCHATHLPAAAAMSQLIVANYRAAGTGYTNPMCVGCHGSGPGINPGVTAYYHPVDGETRPVNVSDLTQAVYQVTTGTFNITVNMSGAFDNGASARITCMSCHGGADGNVANAKRGIHAGTAGTSIISPLKPTCGSCHNVGTVNLGTTTNSHHVYGGGAARGANYATWGYGNPTAGSGTIAYNGTTTVSLSDGLSCEDCHVFNNTAHNWN